MVAWVARHGAFLGKIGTHVLESINLECTPGKPVGSMGAVLTPAAEAWMGGDRMAVE